MPGSAGSTITIPSAKERKSLGNERVCMCLFMQRERERERERERKKERIRRLEISPLVAFRDVDYFNGIIGRFSRSILLSFPYFFLALFLSFSLSSKSS